MQGVGSSMPETRADALLKTGTYELSSAGTKFVLGGLRHLQVPVASLSLSHSKLMMRLESLVSTVGSALVVEAEEWGLRRLKLLISGKRAMPRLKISLYLSAR